METYVSHRGHYLRIDETASVPLPALYNRALTGLGAMLPARDTRGDKTDEDFGSLEVIGILDPFVVESDDKTGHQFVSASLTSY